MKLTRSEAGKLGAIKSNITNKFKKAKRIANYNLTPNKCKYCNSELSYEHRELKFCNQSCAAKYNNEIREQSSIIIWNCLNCGCEKKTIKHKQSKFCSAECYNKFKVNQKITKWLDGDKSWNGQLPGRVKKYIANIRGYKCEECGISEWNNKPITLECDHIDGNSENNILGNLRLICPNCHSQTSTYKAKNKGNGRKYRYKKIKIFPVSLNGKGPH